VDGLRTLEDTAAILRQISSSPIGMSGDASKIKWWKNFRSSSESGEDMAYMGDETVAIVDCETSEYWLAG
jgi:hypothetical protein